MANWHERDCRRPDVVVIDTMITCKSCGSFYTHNDSDGTANRSELQKEVSEFGGSPSDLNLSWPSTVHFSSPDEVDDVNIRDILERLGEMLHEQRRKHQDRQSFSIIDVSSQSSAIITDEKLAQYVGIGEFSVSTTAEESQREKADESRGRATSPVYRSLTGVDEIRLLHLSPRESAEDLILHGYLETISLSARPDFTAVSYTWADSEGNRSLTEKIFLGDHWIPLPITRNCAAALRRLRSHETVWVDSVCINQLNTDEKSHQVGLMRDIFSRAASVMIFLGGDDDTPDALLLKRTSERLFYNEYQEEIVWDAVRDEIAVRALFDRPYWSRIWVVQEVLLSRKAVVILGETAIPLQPLLKARLAEPDGYRRKFSMPRWLHLGKALPVEDFHSLSKLLTETSTCLATDHKDMIFALLGLVQGAHLEGLVADYSKSIHEIRVGIAAYFLIRQGQINTLKSATFNAGQKERLIPGSPSWVPDWGYHPRNEPQARTADSIDAWLFDDFSRSSHSWKWGDRMWCYDTITPQTAINTPVGYSTRSHSTFRVLHGTGALLVKAYPLLCIDSIPDRNAFNCRPLTNRSVLLTPSQSVVRWSIYAAGERWSKDLDFGRPGDWIVEIPGFDDFFHLRQISSLPGACRIFSVCGLAIAMKLRNAWFPDIDLTLPPATIKSMLPRYGSDGLISRLLIFDQELLQFLLDWEKLAQFDTTADPSSKKPGPSSAEPPSSLSEMDIKEYIQWADHVSVNPLMPTLSTISEDALKTVASYLDRWQDLSFWDRIISDSEAVSWPNLLGLITEARSGFWSKHPPERHTFEVAHEYPLPHSGILKTTAKRLNELLLDLTSPSSPPYPVSTVEALRPLLQAVEEADTGTIFEVFETSQDEIGKNLSQLESHLDFMQDSLPRCRVIRDKFFSQRKLLQQLYGRRELREFLIY